MKQLKSILTKIKPTISLMEAPLVMPKGLTKGRERLVSSMFSTKILILFALAISYTRLLYPCITFLWHTLYFPLHSPIIRIIICFRRIIIDIIVYGRKKNVYYFWKENKWHRCLMEEKLNTCIWHMTRISPLVSLKEN